MRSLQVSYTPVCRLVSFTKTAPELLRLCFTSEVRVATAHSRACVVTMVLHRAAGAVSTSSRCIQAGDLVIVYERFDSMKSVYVNPGESYGNRYGNFKLKVGPRSWFSV